MKLHDDRWSFSPTDLANFLRCEHRITLDRKLQRGEIAKPQVRPSAHTDLLVRRAGGKHEQNYVRKLKDQGRNVVEIPDRDEISASAVREQTLDAMKRGADVIVQALLTDDKSLATSRLAAPAQNFLPSSILDGRNLPLSSTLMGEVPLKIYTSATGR